MTRILALLMLCALPASAFAATAAATATPTKPMTDDDKTIFAVGEILSGSVKPFAFTEHEMQLVLQGFSAGIHGKKTDIDPETYRSKIQTLLTGRLAKGVATAKSAGQAYRNKAAAEKGATTTPSGIIMSTVQAGSGPSPAADDQVKVNYEGRLIDGTMFDSSKQHGQPATFKVSGVVPCWTEALQHMSVGSKIKLICPPETAYGDRGSPPQIPGGSTLVFDVELLAVDKAAPPAAPSTPAAPSSPVTPDSPATSAQPAAPATR
jgi:FKBP-type peptidyl-prolyl cis-trans isomerase FkpA